MIELIIFFAGLYVLGAFVLRICEEGDYDDYD